MDTTVPDITVERITPPPRSGRAGKRGTRTTAAVAPKRADERPARRATLYLDMSFSEEVFGMLDEDEQERRVAAFLLGYLEQSLAKYRFRDLDVARFMAVFTDRISEIGWGSTI